MLFADEIRFTHLTTEQGLPQNSVYAIHQDKQGFMWFGTLDGLCRYDGYQFKVYRHSPQDKTSLSHNEVYTIYEDRQGQLWIGTGGGINLFDRKNQQFIHYQHDPAQTNSLSHNIASGGIIEDKRGGLWFSTEGGGLNRFNPKTQQFFHYQHDEKQAGSLSSNYSWALLEDKKGRLWISTDGGGINRFNPKQGRFTYYLYDQQNKNNKHNFVTALFEDSQGMIWTATAAGLYYYSEAQDKFILHPASNQLTVPSIWSIQEDKFRRLWIGTDGGGVYILDLKNQKLENHTYQAKENDSLSNNAVISLYIDRAGSVWLGTDGGGINRYDFTHEKFKHHYHNPKDSTSLSDNTITAILEDQQQQLWVGTAEGLNLYDLQTRTSVHYTHDKDNPNSLGSSYIRSLYEDKQGTLWVGTDQAVLHQYRPKTKDFIRYVLRDKDAESLDSNMIRSIVEDSHGNLWVGTRYCFCRFDRQTEQFTVHYPRQNMNKGLAKNTVLTIYEDCQKQLWVGTQGNGLLGFDEQHQKIAHFEHQPYQANSLSNNNVSSIISHQNTLWIATLGGGLNRLDLNTGQFVHYREAEGLANDTIHGILKEGDEYLWLSTNQGLSRFDLHSKIFKNYTVDDGLQSNEFNSAYYKNSRNEFFFGGLNGFNQFYPKQIQDTLYIPPVVVTGFSLFNQIVEPNTDSPLQQDITTTQQITLSHKQSFFSFEFVGLNFIEATKNQYAYKLQDFDSEWNYINHRRNANYTNVPHGEYIFRVKASNNDGVWNEAGTSIKIRILPAPWQTWWAYALYIILLLSIITWYVRAQQLKLLKKQKELEKITQFLDALPVGIGMMDANGQLLYHNDKANTFFSKKADPNILSSKIPQAYQLYHADTGQLYLSECLPIVRALRGESSSVSDIEVRLADRHTYLEIWGSPILDDNGQVLYALNAIQDITERKQVEQELQRYRLHLEDLVKKRTQDLQHTNEQLQQEILERRLIERALRTNEERFNLAMQGANDGVWDWDLISGETYYSPRYLEMLGINYADIGDYNNGWCISLHPNDVDKFINALLCYVDGKTPAFEVTFRMKHLNGHYIWILGRGIGVRDSNGEFTRLVGTHMDLTQQKHIEQALRKSKEHFRTIFNNAAVGISIIDSEGNYVQANSKWADMLDDDLVSVLQRTEQDVTCPQDQEMSQAQFSALIRGEVDFYQLEKRYVRQDGSDFWADFWGSTIRNLDNQLEAVIGIAVDISERKHAEAALHQKNADLTQALQQLKATQEELIQSEKMAALGQLIAGVAHEINTPLGAIRSSASSINHFLSSTLERLSHLFHELPENKQQLFFNLLYRVVNQPYCNFSSREKRKRRRELTPQLETYTTDATLLADKLVDMGIFDNIEDLIPLFTENGSDDILDIAYQFANLQRGIKNITVASDKAAKVVFALKNFSHFDHTGEKIEADIINGIETVLTLYNSQMKHKVKIHRNYSEIPAIFCYPDELNQMWTNLIHNALQAMNHQGELFIDIDIQEMNIEIKITDTGSGIPDDIKHHIFTPFFTTKPAGEGSGLGLDIVQKIVTKHDGNIDVESCPGKTTFTVHLPISLPK
ncbi:two-component regulator propeller domain-containing protein [Candidatus Albibeggiatoa sp. nov. BB20]|uniref:two-component regulator propeller domain-containing protein n=1 Tax=Candidatus Albibeggiatoa sp. nov. BB20 TaxID=3162723 RepID=UPI0033654742